MDKSEQYIKMCDCKEIQSQWTEKNVKWGDFFHNDGDVTVCLSVLGIRNGREDGEEFVWLPRQDQLQDMISHNKSGVLLLLSLFSGDVYRWKTSYKEQFINSMEQLWLAWVMLKKFNKKWNGKKWTDEKDRI